MDKHIQRFRGTTAQLATYTGPEGELVVDTTKKTVTVHDGTTAGGVPLAKESIALKGSDHIRINSSGENSLQTDSTFTLALGALAADLISEDADNDIVVGTDGLLMVDAGHNYLAGQGIDIDGDEISAVPSEMVVTGATNMIAVTGGKLAVTCASTISSTAGNQLECDSDKLYVATDYGTL